MKTAYFEKFEIHMTLEQAESVSHSGPCDADVEYLLNDEDIQEQLAEISDEDLIAELEDYGAWSEEELSSREDNEARIIWIAGCNIKEEEEY